MHGHAEQPRPCTDREPADEALSQRPLTLTLTERIRMKNDEAQDRIEHVADLMAAGKWQRGKSAASLAAEWGASLRTVQGYAMVAARIVWSASDDQRSELTAETIGCLSKIAVDSMALAESDPTNAPAHHRATIAALDLRADVAGLKPRTAPSVMVTVEVGGKRIAVPAHELVAQMAIVAEVLQRFPKAQRAVIAALEAGKVEDKKLPH